jgi:hypothetical protein
MYRIESPEIHICYSFSKEVMFTSHYSQGVQEMPDQNKETIQQSETVSSDVVALCALLARIMMRCLREKNPTLMRLLSLPSQPGEMETRETHDAA